MGCWFPPASMGISLWGWWGRPHWPKHHKLRTLCRKEKTEHFPIYDWFIVVHYIMECSFPTASIGISPWGYENSLHWPGIKYCIHYVRRRKLNIPLYINGSLFSTKLCTEDFQLPALEVVCRVSRVDATVQISYTAYIMQEGESRTFPHIWMVYCPLLYCRTLISNSQDSDLSVKLAR